MTAVSGARLPCPPAGGHPTPSPGPGYTITTDPAVGRNVNRRLLRQRDTLADALAAVTHRFAAHPDRGLCADCTLPPDAPVHATPDTVLAAIQRPPAHATSRDPGRDPSPY